MGASPQWKVYNASALYMGCTKEPAAAVILAEFYGSGSTVRYGHNAGRKVWSTDEDTSENWEEAEALMRKRAGLE